ncbi:oxidoreductase [Byssothecium circinans]|uniref:Oxidoreductase n=1 Tax=Byssothecium circinans TaxID=147558 RepID=A0A6A5T7C5_9PLEO|nr:oxidoreductase [Byssothecium circinans]
MRGLNMSILFELLLPAASSQCAAPYDLVAQPSNQTFDYVIVGGGLAGLTVAARLAEDPTVTVGVIEAGDFYDKLNGNRSKVPGYGAQVSTPAVDWNLTSIPQPQLNGRNTTYRAARCVAGGTAINLLAYHRSTAGAYDRWASLVGDESFQFKNFLPWMRKSIQFTPANTSIRAKNATVPDAKKESYDAAGGPVQVTFANWANPVASYAQAAWKALGLNTLQDLTSGTLLGNQYTPVTQKASDQSRSTSESFLDYGVDSGRENLFLFPKSTASRVTFDAQQNARSIIAHSNGLVFELKARREVILAAGVMHTPQLLLLSGIGPSATLTKFNIPIVKDLPGVGKNLNDHPIFQVAYEASAVTGSSLLDPLAADAAAEEYVSQHTGILTHNMADHFAWGKPPPAEFSPHTNKELAQLPSDWPHYEVVVANIGWAPGNFAEGVVMLQATTSRGSVSISSSNITDPPLLDVQTLSTSTDRELVIGAFKLVRQLFNTTSLREITGADVRPGIGVGTSWTDDEILDWLRRNMSPGSHGCCTAAMGNASERDAVVDTEGRVWGVKGLRVVDASALPFLPPGHPVSTLYGLAEKFANDIKVRRQT